MIHPLFAQEDKSPVLSFFDLWGNAASFVGLDITWNHKKSVNCCIIFSRAPERED
jgi:hypothetical protein